MPTLPIITANLPAITSTYLLGSLLVVLLFLFLYRTQEQTGRSLLAGLMIWLPVEAVVLKHVPDQLYLIKYLPEIILYTLCAAGWIKYIHTTGRFIPPNPLTRPILLFVVVSFGSLLLNWYSPTVWLLGLRQILRFVAVYLFVLTQSYPKTTIKKFLLLAAVVAGAEAGIGILQYAAGGRFDAWLFSTRTVAVGEMALLGGIEQFWTPGTRVFATMGRYDQLGSFLALSLILLFSVREAFHEHIGKIWTTAALGALGVGLVLTASRASWVAAAVGLAIVGAFLMKSARFVQGAAVAAVALIVYLGLYAAGQANIGAVTDRRMQTLPERVYEAVSWKSWRESYDGYGRIFFIVNTPRLVVPAAPFFGVGPGNFGGGVAAALLNTGAYDRLRLPFGIENTYGQIDNSWMAIWGETGTLGLAAWGAVFVVLIRSALSLAKKTRDTLALGLSRATIGLSAGVMVQGFFGPYFEFRTLMFYFWLIAGFMMTYWRMERQRGSFLAA